MRASVTFPAMTAVSPTRLEAALPWIAALLAVAAGAVSLGGGFVWDDRWLILQSPLLRDPGLLPQVVLGGHGWGTMVEPGASSAYYRPLGNLLHGALLIAVGPHPLPFRVLSLGVHAAAAFLLAVLLRRIGGAAAAWGAVLFAVHPVAADTYAWISALPDSLAAVFLLGSLLFAVRTVPEPAVRGVARPRPANAVAAGALWLAALLSKESAVVALAWLPLLALALRSADAARGRHGALAPRGIWIALAVGLLVYGSLRFAGPGFRNPAGSETVLQIPRAILTGRVFLADAAALLLPLRLYLTAPGWVTSSGGVATGVLGVVALLGAAAASIGATARARGTTRVVGIAGLLVLASLLPALQIVRTNEVYAGRFLYLATAALGAGAGLVIASRPSLIPTRSAAATVAALAVILGLGALSSLRAAQWRSNDVLFAREYGRNPSSVSAGTYFAGHLINSGRHAAARPVVDALERRAPSDPNVRYLGALLSMNDGRVAEAGSVFAELERTWRASPTLLANLAACQMRTGRLEEGLATLDRATRHLTPTPGMRNNRGLALQLLGRREEAMREFESAIADDPRYEPARVNLIRLLATSQDERERTRALDEGRGFLEDFPQSGQAPVVRSIVDTLQVSRRIVK